MANTTERRHFVNNAPQTTLTAGISNSDTTCAVSSLTGWPSSVPFLAVLEANTTNEEIVEVTSVVGTTLTITRGQDGTAAVSHLSGATVDQGVVRRDFDEANAHSSATAGVHGVAGDVVGTTDAQTLSNKTITAAPSITSTGTIHGGDLTATGMVTAGGGADLGPTNITGDVTVSGGVVSGGSITTPREACQVKFLSLSVPAGGTAAFTNGVAEVNTLGAVADNGSNFNTITIPAGKGGQYKLSGQVVVTDVNNRLQVWIDKGSVGNALMQRLVGPAGGGTTGNSCDFSPREFTLAAGDTIRIVGDVIGATGWTSTSANGFDTWLRVERVG